MGVGQRKSKGSKGGHKTKNKQFKKGHATKNRRKDVDQIQDELKVEEEKKEETKFEIDDDLPGQGQFYCTPCARHFIDEQTRAVHIKSKLHKRRMKDVAQEQYTQEEAERGAGMTREKHPPAHPPSSLSMTPNIEKPDVAGALSSIMDVGDPEQGDPDL